MSLPALKKIQEINKKIDQLKAEQRKLQSILEKKIIDTLHQQDAFSYDFDILLAGIHYVLEKMKSLDEHSLEICASWKQMNLTKNANHQNKSSSRSSAASQKSSQKKAA